MLYQLSYGIIYLRTFEPSTLPIKNRDALPTELRNPLPTEALAKVGSFIFPQKMHSFFGSAKISEKPIAANF